MVPFINSTIRLLIASPRPVPPNFLVLDPSSCVNGLKMLSAVSVSKPTPWSITSNRIISLVGESFNLEVLSLIVPVCENFTALLNKFDNTCLSRVGSPLNNGLTPLPISISILIPFLSAACLYDDFTASMTR